MTATPTQQPEALKLADVLHEVASLFSFPSALLQSAAELRYQHAEIARLTAENEALKATVSNAVAAEREACAKACESSANRFGEETPWAAGYVQGILDVACGIRARGTP